MKKQSFIKGSVILLISALIVKIIGALFKIPLTNMLGGTAMGYFSCAYGIFLPIYAVTGTGLGSAVAKITAESNAKYSAADAKRVYSVSLMFFGLLGALFSVILFFGAKSISVSFLDSPQSQTAVALIAPSVLFGCISAVARGYFEGLNNMYPTAVSQVFEAVSKLVFGLAFAEFAHKNFEDIKPFLPQNTTSEAAMAAAAVLGISLSTLIGTLCLFLFSKDKTEGKTSASSLSKGNDIQILGNVFSTMLPIALGALVTNLTSMIDLFTINRMFEKCISDNYAYFVENYAFMRNMPPDEIPEFVFGSYTGLAITIFTLVPSVTNMLGKSVLSAASEASAKNNKKMLQSAADKAFALTAFIALPCALGIFVMAKPILQLLYAEKTNEIDACHTALSILGISVIFLCFSCPAFSLLQGTSHAESPVKIMLCGVAAKFIGNIVFLRFEQTALFGAAISTLICYVLIFTLSVVTLKRKCGITFCFANITPYLLSAMLCSISAGFVYISCLAKVSSKYACCIAILCAGLIYLGVLCLYMAVKKQNRFCHKLQQNRFVK